MTGPNRKNDSKSNNGSSLQTYLDITQVDALERTATNLRDRLLIRFSSHTGCRISEALAVEVEHIDFERGLVRIQHLKTRSTIHCPKCETRLGRKHTFCPNCGQVISDSIKRDLEKRRQRILPVDARTLFLLREYIDRGGLVSKNGRRLVFGINRHRAWQIVKECAERAGLPKLINPESGRLHNVSPHRLRDFLAVHALKINDSGEGMRLLQEQLGHQNFNTTARYRKLGQAELTDWYRTLWNQSDAH
ncbi:MAG: tyrosine-type recombinase/integrase [Dehalogenimonas sp.]